MLRNELPALLQYRSLSVATVLTLNSIILFVAPSLLFPRYTTYSLLQIYNIVQYQNFFVSHHKHSKFLTRILYHSVPYSSFPPPSLWCCTCLLDDKKSSTTQSAEVQFEICKHYFAGPGNLWSDLSSTANALISSRLDRTACEAIVRQQPHCNMQLNGVDEMQAKDGCNVDE